MQAGFYSEEIKKLLGGIVSAIETVGIQRMLKYVWASASTPGFFPPLPDDKRLLVDGSILVGVDITAAIERCREIVEDDADIILDVIMVHASNIIFLLLLLSQGYQEELHQNAGHRNAVSICI